MPAAEAAQGAARSRLAGRVPPAAATALSATALVACVSGALATSRAGQWRPVGLVAVTAAFVVVCEVSTVSFAVHRRSLASVGLVLAMVFLGPAPAVVIAVVPVMADTLRVRSPLVHVVSNPANYAIFTLAGALASGALLGRPPEASPETLLWFVIALALAVDAFSFVFAAGARAVYNGVSLRWSFRREFVPVTPYLVISGAFTGAAGIVWTTAGLGALAGLLLMLVVSGRIVGWVARGEAREQEVARLAIERARLLGESLTAEERERTRLAAEIHDDALQELALAEIELRQAAGGDEDALVRGRDSVTAAAAALRRTLGRIVPVAEMRSAGLEATLRAMVGDLTEPAGLDWSVAVAADAVPADRTLVCSLARELVTNAVKHAAASRVDVRVSRRAGELRLEVRDDGKGFELAQAPQAGHVGLTLVENRARAAGGQLAISSRPAGGTSAVVELPLVARATSVPSTADAEARRA